MKWALVNTVMSDCIYMVIQVKPRVYENDYYTIIDLLKVAKLLCYVVLTIYLLCYHTGSSLQKRHLCI